MEESLHFVQSSGDISEDLVNSALSRNLKTTLFETRKLNLIETYHAALGVVVLDDGL